MFCKSLTNYCDKAVTIEDGTRIKLDHEEYATMKTLPPLRTGLLNPHDRL